MLPNPLIVRAYLSRSARLWLVTRVLLSGVFLLAGINPFQLSGAVGVEVIVLSVALSFLESRRCREGLFLANLGIRPLILGALFTGPAVIGEVALHFGGSALR